MFNTQMGRVSLKPPRARSVLSGGRSPRSTGARDWPASDSKGRFHIHLLICILYCGKKIVSPLPLSSDTPREISRYFDLATRSERPRPTGVADREPGRNWLGREGERVLPPRLGLGENHPPGAQKCVGRRPSWPVSRSRRVDELHLGLRGL